MDRLPNVWTDFQDAVTHLLSDIFVVNQLDS